jgi:hypothetical protein
VEFFKAEYSTVHICPQAASELWELKHKDGKGFILVDGSEEVVMTSDEVRKRDICRLVKALECTIILESRHCSCKCMIVVPREDVD